MYLSFSGYAKYKDCPYAYWHQYIGKTVPEEPEDRLGSIYGTVVGAIFEDFYNKQLWRSSPVVDVLLELVDPIIERTLKQETTERKGRPAGVIKWKGSGPGQNPNGMYADVGELKADVVKAVRNGVEIIRFHRLIGARAVAEMKLDSKIGKHLIAGRCDVLVSRVKPHGDLVICDGKGSKHRDAYVKPDQLLWYAMLLEEQEKRLPDKLAFVFWRCPPESSVDWVHFDAAMVHSLRETILGVADDIEAKQARLAGKNAVKVFQPKPSPEACRFCPYGKSGQCSSVFRRDR